MNRRVLLQNSILGTMTIMGFAATVTKSQVAKAQVAIPEVNEQMNCPPTPLGFAIHSEISNNHRHDVGAVG